MPQEQTLGELLREFTATLGEYAKQQAADAVQRALVEPLRVAARKAVLLGLAVGLGVMTGVCLALALFHCFLTVLSHTAAAYAACALLSALLAVLCAWMVTRSGKGARRGNPWSDRERPGPAVAKDPDASE